MPLTRKGRAGWFLESPGTLQTDRYGLSSAVARWARYDLGATDPGTPTSFGMAHPIWSSLSCDKVQISHQGTHWQCEASFFGVYGSPQPIYEIDIRTSEEPIESHPEFNTFAYPEGTFGSKFDADGQFLGFYPILNEVSEITNKAWVGVRGFLSPSVVWRKRYVSTTRPSSVSNVGWIDTPEGSPPSYGGDRNWLYNGLTWEQRGLTYTVSKEWLLSGPLGWNVGIYG